MQNFTIITVLFIVLCVSIDFGYAQTSSYCEFRCNTGECIASELLCDGRSHCKDQSDETEAECSKPEILCPEYAFRCKYGACISKAATCDGIKDCVDNSDETLPWCNLNSYTILTVSRVCVAPAQPKNGYWKLHRTRCANGQDCNITEGVELKLASHLVYSCNQGYKLRGSADVSCSLGGKWLNVPVCTEIRCKALNTVSTNASCIYHNESISCETPVLPKTVAHLDCRNSYHRDDRYTKSTEVRCNENGQWEPEPIRCIPACGVLPANRRSLIINGTQPNITELPWHASMHRDFANTPKKYFCGATIIQKNLLVTAAHCVYDEPNKRVIDANQIHILAGNVFRDYDSPYHDMRIVQKARVKNIYINCNYLGLKENYLWDIAVLELIEPFILSGWLIPVCLDPYIHGDQTVLVSGASGKVTGFDRITVGNSSAILQALKVPYFPFHQCNSVSRDTKTEQFLTIDKFCGRYKNDSSVCHDDHGGGLVFKTTGLWYLRGIVSVSLSTTLRNASTRCDNNLYTLYTRVSSHIEWIQDIITELEQRKIYPLCPNKSFAGSNSKKNHKLSIDFRHGQTTKNCELERFRCHTGECIASELLCDGRPHCKDQSDETESECSKPEILCPEYSFRCKYGACINKAATCDGIKDCIDNSDETLPWCNLKNQTILTVPTFCVVPPQPQNGYRKLHRTRCVNGEDCDIADGVELKLASHLVYSCNQGYKLRGSADVSCSLGGKWLNIPVCTEIRCKTLNTASTDASCMYHNKSVSCESPVLPKTVAHLFCRNGYHRDDRNTKTTDVRCNENGQWDPEPIRCIPACGVLPANRRSLIINGTQPNITELPWHASMHRDFANTPKKYFCGATIIQKNLLVTAAHCVYDEQNKRVIDANQIHILAGNVFRDYDSPYHDMRIVQKARVKNIHINCNYLGLKENYLWDIAVLELIEPFILSGWLIPVCLDPYIHGDQTVLVAGASGKVTGFGKTTLGNSSTILQALKVPYFPFHRCKSVSRDTETEQFLTIDKFCGRYKNGSSVCNDDRGGGLVFQTAGSWYLRGIVSVSLGTILHGESAGCHNNLYTLYTRVSSHIEWIQDIITELEQNKIYPLCPNKSFADSNNSYDFRYGQTTNNCELGRFQCYNGECIASELLCDGRPHCKDQSDETEAECSKPEMCPEYSFRCTYGACINADATCNGIKDCIDNSDETLSRCNLNNQTILNVSRFCAAPPQPENGYWKLHRTQCVSGYDCDIAEGVKLESGSHLVYTCNPGYKPGGPVDVSCSLEGKWLNIPICTEIRCKALSTVSTDARCTYNNEWVSCESSVLPGTVAQVSCRNSYRRETNVFLLQSDSVRCNKNGQWNPEPIRCVPVCGILSADVVPQIINGTRPNITEFPWHASMYYDFPNASKKYFCGASIIQENLLVTAAHCVYDEQNKRVIDAKRIYVVTGNIYRNYDSPYHDPRIVKKAQVKNIYINCNFLGLTGNYLWDIAVLELIEPFVLSNLLVPACLDLSTNNDITILESGVYGKVAGFGKTATADSSAILQALNVPYIPFHQCKSASQDAETEQFLTLDKFCAGYTNGSSICDGDSGGGLVFKTKGLWYLRGIVSVSLGTIFHGGRAYCDNNLYTLYTRVSNHITWIQEIMRQLEQNKTYPLCPNKS